MNLVISLQSAANFYLTYYVTPSVIHERRTQPSGAAEIAYKIANRYL